MAVVRPVKSVEEVFREKKRRKASDLRYIKQCKNPVDADQNQHGCQGSIYTQGHNCCGKRR